MSENIVVLSGSPRQAGNTDKLVAAFIEGAESAGKKVTLFRVAEMSIAGCLGCGHCRTEKGGCVQKDDMLPIIDALQKADALVLASPVYYFGVTAQLKLVIDRTYALLRTDFPVRRAALLMTCGNKSSDVADGAILTYVKTCALYRWENAGAIVVPGLHAPDEILGREELQQARELGRTF